MDKAGEADLDDLETVEYLEDMEDMEDIEVMKAIEAYESAPPYPGHPADYIGKDMTHNPGYNSPPYPNINMAYTSYPEPGVNPNFQGGTFILINISQIGCLLVHFLALMCVHVIQKMLVNVITLDVDFAHMGYNNFAPKMIVFTP